MSNNTIQISSNEMEEVLFSLFRKYKFSNEKAHLLASTYTESTLHGVFSHGINRVPLFIEYIEKRISESG